MKTSRRLGALLISLVVIGLLASVSLAGPSPFGRSVESGHDVVVTDGNEGTDWRERTRATGRRTRATGRRTRATGPSAAPRIPTMVVALTVALPRRPETSRSMQCERRPAGTPRGCSRPKTTRLRTARRRHAVSTTRSSTCLRTARRTLRRRDSSTRSSGWRRTVSVMRNMRRGRQSARRNVRPPRPRSVPGRRIVPSHTTVEADPGTHTVAAPLVLTEVGMGRALAVPKGTAIEVDPSLDRVNVTARLPLWQRAATPRQVREFPRSPVCSPPDGCRACPYQADMEPTIPPPPEARHAGSETNRS